MYKLIISIFIFLSLHLWGQMDTVIQLNSFARSETVGIWANDTSTYVLVNTSNALSLPSGFSDWKGQSDFLLICYDSNQVYQRHWEFGGFYADFAYHLKFHNQALYIAGSFDREIYIDGTLYQEPMGRCGIVIRLDLYNYDIQPFILEGKNVSIKDLTFYHDQAVVVGGFYDTIIFQTDTIDGGLGKDLFVASYDLSFNQLNWYDFSEGNATELIEVDRTLDGIYAVGSYSDGVVLGGEVLTNDNTNHNLIIVKYNDIGGLEWYKTFESIAELHGKSIACGTDEIVIGAEYEGAVFDNGQAITQTGVGYDGLLLVLDDLGNLKKSVSFEGQGNEIVQDLKYLGPGDYLILAQTGNNTFANGELLLNNGFNENVILQYNTINEQMIEVGRVRGEAPSGVVLGNVIHYDGQKIYQGGENLTKIENHGLIYEASNFGEAYWSMINWEFNSLYNSISENSAFLHWSIRGDELEVSSEGLLSLSLFDLSGRCLLVENQVIGNTITVKGNFSQIFILKLLTKEGVKMLKIQQF